MTTAVAQKRKGLLGNEKGLTLIELLAVIVILAIIAAIAIPSIGGIINRTKKESHRANAQMIVDAARYAVTAEGFPMAGKSVEDQGKLTEKDINGNPVTIDTDYFDVTLQELNDKGYLENVPKDPEAKNKETYDAENSQVRIHRVDATGKYRYQIKLIDSNGKNVFADVDSDGFINDIDIKESKLAGD